MIGYIKGTVEDVTEDSCTIDNQGIGYVIKVPTDYLERLSVGQKAKIYTYLYVREEQLTLFGFESKNQLHMFEKLILVNGIGPKAAIGILSTMSVSALMMAIVSQDAKAISKAPGIGTKTAQKLILELKDKVSAENILYQEVAEVADAQNQSEENQAKHEAVMALVSLGYDRAVALKAVAKIKDSRNMDTESILKEALKYMLK